MEVHAHTHTAEGIATRVDEIASYRGELSAKIFHNKYYIRDTTHLVSAAGILKDTKLINDDPALLAEYSNRTYSRAQVLKNYINMLQWTGNKAVRLMEIIRQQYHFK